MTPTDPNVLLNAAVCYDCNIPPGIQGAVSLYLLVQWANASAAPPYPCGTPSNTIQISGAGSAGANQTYTFSGGNWTSADNLWLIYQVPITLGQFQWIVVSIASGFHQFYEASLSAFPCVFTLSGEDVGVAPPPTGQYV